MSDLKVSGGLERKSTEYWEELYWKVLQQWSTLKQTTVEEKHFLIRARGLTELNHKQAGKLMERDFTIRQLKEQIMTMQEDNNNLDNVIDIKDFPRLKLDHRPPPPTGNWLGAMEKGTRFLANRRAMNDAELHDFLVGSNPKMMPAVYIGYDLASREGGFKFVDPVKFSRDYEFFCIIKVEVENDSPDVPTGTVDSDGKD